MAVPQQAKMILDFIGEHEAPEGYGQVYGGVENPPKDLTEMTVGEVLVWQKRNNPPGPGTAAAGRYQFIQPTLAGLVKQGVVKPTDRFDEETQDRLGFELLRGRGFNRYARGEMSPVEFGNQLAMEWAGLPVLSGPKAGRSYYRNDGVNSALTTSDKFLAQLQAGQKRPDASTPETAGAGNAPDGSGPDPATLADPPFPTGGEIEVSELNEVGDGADDPVARGFRSRLPRSARPVVPGSFLGDLGRGARNASGAVDATVSFFEGLSQADTPPPVAGFDPLKSDIYKRNPQHWRAYARAGSPEELQQIHAEVIRRRTRARKIQSGGRTIAPILGAIATPETAIDIALVPTGAGLGFVRGGMRVGAGVAGIETGSEFLRHKVNPTATARESVVNVGSATLLGGAFGGTFGLLGRDRAQKLAETFREDVQAMHGLARPSERIRTGRGREVKVNWRERTEGNDTGPAVSVAPGGQSVTVDAAAVSEEFAGRPWRDLGLEDDLFPTPNHWAEFRARLAVEEYEEALPFGGWPFEVTDEIIATGRRWRIVQRKGKENRPAAVLNRRDEQIEIDPDKLVRLWEERAWTKPRQQADGSRAEALPEDQFQTLEDWINFTIAHEVAHLRMKPARGENMGAFETRVNQAALEWPTRYTRPLAEGAQSARQAERSGRPPAEVLVERLDQTLRRIRKIEERLARTPEANTTARKRLLGIRTQLDRRLEEARSGLGRAIGDRAEADRVIERLRGITPKKKAKETRAARLKAERDGLRKSLAAKQSEETRALVESQLRQVEARLARLEGFRTRDEWLEFRGEKSVGDGPGATPPPEPPRGAAAAGDGGDPLGRAAKSYRDWHEGNRRELKKRMARLIDKMVGTPYKRVHDRAAHAQTRHLMDMLAMDAGLQTVANWLGETPGASIATMAKVWDFETQKLLDAETTAYEKYLGAPTNPRFFDVPVRKEAEGLRQTVGLGSRRPDGSRTLSREEFSARASRAHITGRPDEIPEVNELAEGIKTFYETYRRAAEETGVLGGMSGENIGRQIDDLGRFVGQEPRPAVGAGTSGERPAVKPTGLHRDIEKAIRGRQGDAAYDQYATSLHEWRQRFAEKMDAQERHADKIRAAFRELDKEPPDLARPVEGDQGVRGWFRRNTDLDEEEIGRIFDRAGDKPQPPLDRADPEQRLLDDMLQSAARQRAHLEDVRDSGRKVSSEVEEDYFTRVWNIRAIDENEEVFRNVLRRSLSARGMPGERLDRAVDEVIEEIRQTGGHVEPGRFRDTVPGSMQKRGLDIPNRELVGQQGASGETVDFIELDAVQVASSYGQRMAPYIELARRFNGEDGLRNPHLAFRKAMLDTLREERAAFKGDDFAEHWAPIERDLEFMKDRVMKATMVEPWRWDNRAASVLKDWATLVFMGRAVISTMPDAAKMQMTHGFDEVARFGSMQLDEAIRPAFRAASLEGRKAGALTDVALGGLMKRFAEVGTDPVFLSRGEKLLRATANRYFIANLLGPATYAMRSLSGAISAHRFMDEAVKVADGTATRAEAAHLAQHGIDRKMAGRIRKMVDEGHAKRDPEGDVWLANSDAWSDAEAVRAYRGAILTETDNTILVASAADKPAAVDGVLHFRAGRSAEIDKAMEKLGAEKRGEFWRVQSGLAGLPFQFWNYMMAATQKIAVAGAEDPNARFLAGMTAMIGMGYMALSIRTPDWAWNDMSMTDRVSRVIDQSGITGVMAEYAWMFQNGFSGITGENPFPFNYRWGRKPTGLDAAMDFAGPGPAVLGNAVEGIGGIAAGSSSAVSTLGWAVPFRNHIVLSDTIEDGLDAVQSAL